jgi:uncharacterized protein YdeI (YjbR/CyaY-like superfamily)
MLKDMPMLDVRTRAGWRKWLEEHHATVSEIWLVFHKVHTGVDCLGYDDAVEEALCFGWIDGMLRRVDDERYIRRFTPRKQKSNWSTLNVRRYAKMRAAGLLAAPGLKRSPSGACRDAPRPSLAAIPSYIHSGLKRVPLARQNFEQLSPSCRRAYIGWIDSAKRQETKEKRLRDAIRMLKKGKKLGMK